MIKKGAVTPIIFQSLTGVTAPFLGDSINRFFQLP